MSPKVSEEHKDARRKEILEVAARVFIRKGYEKTTMKDIVEESGMSRGGVYMYFSSTEEMMLGIQEEMDEENEDQIDAALEAFGGSVWRTMEAMMLAKEQECQGIAQGLAPVLYEFYLAGFRQGKHMDLLDRRYKRAEALFTAMVERGVANGEFRPLVPTSDLARFSISLLDGMTLDATLLGADRISIGKQVQIALTALRHLLQVQASTK